MAAFPKPGNTWETPDDGPRDPHNCQLCQERGVRMWHITVLIHTTDRVLAVVKENKIYAPTPMFLSPIEFCIRPNQKTAGCDRCHACGMLVSDNRHSAQCSQNELVRKLGQPVEAMIAKPADWWCRRMLEKEVIWFVHKFSTHYMGLAKPMQLQPTALGSALTLHVHTVDGAVGHCTAHVSVAPVERPTGLAPPGSQKATKLKNKGFSTGKVTHYKWVMWSEIFGLVHNPVGAPYTYATQDPTLQPFAQLVDQKGYAHLTVSKELVAVVLDHARNRQLPVVL